ncbi:MAG: polysaccharide biosynthesis/export family protein [Acidobacteriota bacterium]
MSHTHSITESGGIPALVNVNESLRIASSGRVRSASFLAERAPATVSHLVRSAFICGCVLAVLSLGWTVPSAQAQAGDLQKFFEEYKIGAKDLLEIRVFGLDELNTTTRVSEDGTISLPLLGQVVVAGLTKGVVEEKLSTLLEARYLKNAQVTVFIKEYQSRRVAVVGAVKNPGTYELLGRQTVIQILSQAGGLTESAGTELFILRESRSGLSARLDVDLEKLLVEGNTRLNVPLYPNDVVNVPIDKPITIYVFGQVRNPGALQVKKSKGITLLQAIAQAGGTTDRASKSGITIKKKDELGREVKVTVNLNDILKGKRQDVPMEDGYVVYVPESLF